MVTVEHCDSVAGPAPQQKGYLTLDDELEALQKAGEQFALTVNWGRSAIEGRSAGTPVEHVARARAAGRLGGVMFSGVDRPARPRSGRRGWTRTCPRPPAATRAWPTLLP